MNSKPPLRSQSVGSIPREKKHVTSRVESVSGAILDVRCACQYYQCDSLLPERINPVGFRPESNTGFVSDLQTSFGSRTGHELFVERPGMQYDQMSVRSCAVGHGLHPDIEKKNIPLESSRKELEFDHDLSSLDIKQPKTQGLVVRSISDATDPEMLPPPWKQRAVSIDRLSHRSFRMRDPDTISTRSAGVRRISRTPSKTNLYVADINIPSFSNISASRRGSKIDIPQINFIAPTPTREMKIPFSVYDEFRKNKEAPEEPMQTETENKENIPSSLSDTCGPANRNFKDSFPPEPGQGSSGFSNQLTIFKNDSLLEGNQSGSDEGNYHQRQQKLPKDISNLKGYHAVNQDIHRSDNKPATLSFDMPVKQTLPKLEEQPKQEPTSFIKSLFKSNKSFEPNNTSEASTKDESFSFKSYFKSNKPREFASEPPACSTSSSMDWSKEETSNLISTLKPIKLIESSENIKREEISLKPAPIKQIELVVVEEEEKLPERTKPLVIDTAIKAVTPSEAMETFSLKVDDLDQYAIRSKTVEPIPAIAPQKLKVSNIDLSRTSQLLDEKQCTQRTPTPLSIPLPVSIDGPTLLSKRNNILRSSQPELSTQERAETISIRDRSAALHQQELTSVPITVPEPSASEKQANEEFLEEYLERSVEASVPSQNSLKEDTTSQAISKVESNPLPTFRSTSRERMMQSKLLRRKDYFNRTQSQDRTPHSPSKRDSMGDLQSGRLEKTVSFDFGSHQSRRTSHESETLNRFRDKKDWIERTYFMRYA